jgi:hypothetical protein
MFEIEREVLTAEYGIETLGHDPGYRKCLVLLDKDEMLDDVTCDTVER